MTDFWAQPAPSDTTPTNLMNTQSPNTSFSPPIQKFLIQEPDENPLDEMIMRMLELVRTHQLNEVITWFQMADEFQVRFSPVDIRKIYDIVQSEVISLFGAPLASSLFPSFLFEDYSAIPYNMSATQDSATNSLSSFSNSKSQTSTSN